MGRAGLALFFLAFLLLSCLFHYRAFTEGILIAPDNDAIRQNYPLKHLYSHALKTRQFPLWNPYMYDGAPMMAEMQNGVLYPVNIALYLALPPTYAYNASYILHLALAGFFTFLYLRLIGVGPLAAFAGGAVFGFSGFLIVNKDHTAIVNSAAYLPLIVYFLERLRRTTSVRASLMLALAVAVQLLAGNMQVCVYTYMVAGFFLAWHAIGKGFFLDGRGAVRFLLLGALGFALGVVIASPQIISTMELSKLSWMSNTEIYRGYEYFSLFRLYALTLPSLIAPHLFSGWGPADNMLILIGVLPIVIALTVLIRDFRGDHVAFWGVVAAMGLVLALGSDTPLGSLMYHVPAYNVFRAHGRNLLEVTLAVSVLFAIGLQGIFDGGPKRRDHLVFAFAALSVSVLLMSFAAMMARFAPLEGIVRRLAAAGFLSAGNIRNALAFSAEPVYAALAILAAYLVWVLASLKSGRKVIAYAAVALVLLEVFYISGFRGISGPPLAEAENLCDEELYGSFVEYDPGQYRIANIFKIKSPLLSNPSAHLTCRVGSVNAYDPLVQLDYAALLDLWLVGTYTLYWDDIVQNNVVLGMLGVKYIKASADSGVSMSGIMASDHGPAREKVPVGGWRLYEAKSAEDGSMVLGQGSEVLSGPLSLEAGTYEITLRARARQGADGRLIVKLMAASGAEKEVLHLFPERLGTEFSEFHQVIRAPKPDVYMLGLYSFSSRPVEAEGPRLVRLNDYAPLSLLGDRLPQSAFPVYEELGESGGFSLYLNRNYLPRAWAVTRVSGVKGFEEMKRRLYALEVNPAEEAMLSEQDALLIGQGTLTGGEVEVLEESLNGVRLKASFPGMGFAVLADHYYPGWRAFIDGERTSIFRVNGILRGVAVPAGTHEVDFLYRPYGIISLLVFSFLLTSSMVVYLLIVPEVEPRADEAQLEVNR